VFAARLERWGIGNDSTVVAYDESSGAIAARLWWMLRWLGHSSALVLDGGFSAWQARGLSTESDAPNWQPARFVPRRIATEAWVETDSILELQEHGNILVDVRAASRFRGEQEPIDPVAGHVPGARNWPFSNNLVPDGQFRDPSDLRRDLCAFLGARPAREVIAMCGSGVTACHLLLAMAVAGLEPGRLYPGSWSEWIRDPARPVRTGAEP
jgi:thiosulfate/3-mercaptopyruvate sulfurtransferase